MTTDDAMAAIRRYHRVTKHWPGRYAPGPGGLDWANQPNPFRRFADAPLHPLPLVAGTGRLTYDDLYAPAEGPAAPLDAEALGLLLELGLGLSAWKEYQGTRWALRNNPSSGNLHPTEGYVVLTRALDGGLGPGVYHYAPHEHGLEERCRLPVDAATALSERLGDVAIGLTSVHWREAWKYGERAYRYCQHDAGHAIASLCFGARVLGWPLRLVAGIPDKHVAVLLGLDRAEDFAGAESEHPDALLAVGPAPDGALPQAVPAALAAASWAGRANRLSDHQVEWPQIHEAEQATVQTDGLPVRAAPEATVEGAPHPAGTADAVTIIRQRRSAVDMDGRTGLSGDAFFGMLARTVPDPARPPWDAWPHAPGVALALFVHRVDGLAPGLYVLARNPDRLPALRAACADDRFTWAPVADSGLPLFALITDVDLREVAAAVSCGQAIAGDSAFSLGMVADFEAVLGTEGPSAYRRLFWETGIIGQVLYLEAEARGVRATGIGCFFDDLMHQVLGMAEDDEAWQSLYHFTVGGAVDDPRLRTAPPYKHLRRA